MKQTEKMSAINFDDVLDVLGAEGRYQTVLYYLLCIPAAVPAAFIAFVQVPILPQFKSHEEAPTVAKPRSASQAKD